MSLFKTCMLATRYDLSYVGAWEDAEVRARHVVKGIPSGINMLAAVTAGVAIGFFVPFLIQPNWWPNHFSADFFQTTPGIVSGGTAVFAGYWSYKQTYPSLRHHIAMVVDPATESARAVHARLKELVDVAIKLIIAVAGITIPAYLGYRCLRVLLIE